MQKNQIGISITEILISVTIMGTLIGIAAPVMILPALSKKKQMAETKGAASYLVLQKLLNRALSSVNPLRFNPQVTLINDQLGSPHWLTKNGVTLNYAQIPTFQVNGLTLTQDSTTLELFEILEVTHRAPEKRTRGLIASRCASLNIYDTSTPKTLESLLNLKRPFPVSTTQRCCAGGVCNDCVKPNFECCDQNRTYCSKSPDDVMILILSFDNQTEIFPKESDLVYNPGMGFVIQFDGNPADSFKVTEFNFKNTCFNKLENNCPINIQSYLLDAKLHSYIQLNHRSRVGSALSDFKDGSFISLGNRFIKGAL